MHSASVQAPWHVQRAAATSQYVGQSITRLLEILLVFRAWQADHQSCQKGCSLFRDIFREWNC